MAGERRFTRIPPESSGDRVGMNAFLDVAYSGLTTPFVIGDQVDFVSSGLSGDIAYVRDDGGNTGLITIDLSNNSRENNTFATINENIQVGGVTYAQASDTGTELYLPKFNLASGENPVNLQTVDRQGAAFIRFSDGPAQLDAFGKLRISTHTVTGEYTHTTGLNDDMSATVASGGTVTHDATKGMAKVSTTTGAGSLAEHRSNLWHPYFPGVSQLGMFSLYHGDAGKTNNTRRWGLFDDFNGVYFELIGTTLYATVRSNTSGSIVETRTAQTDWNADKLDGTGSDTNKSGLTINIQNTTLYWIDFEWLGSGRIRWGIFNNGERITCHEHQHAASNAWAKYGSLPVTIDIENTGAAGSGSDIYVSCCAVHSEAIVNPKNYGRALYATRDSMQVNSTPFYVGTIRTTPNTHSAYVLTSIDSIAMEVGNNAGVELRYYVGPTLTTPSFTEVGIGGSNLQIDTTGTVTSNGTLLGKGWTVGRTIEPQASSDSLQHAAYKSYANGAPFSVAVWATRVDGSTANCTFDIQMTFREIANAFG